MVFDQPGVSQVQGRGWQKSRAPSENGKKLSVPAVRGVGLGTRQGLRLEKRVRVPRPFQELGSHVLGSVCPMCACLTSVSGWSLRNDWGEATNQKAAAFLQARQEGVPVRGDRAGGAEGRGQCCGLLGKQSPQNEMLRASLIGLVVQMDVRRTGWDLPTHEHGVAIHF